MQPIDLINVMNKEDGNEHVFITFERALGESLKPFMAEVYLVNAGVMAEYVYGKREANLRDIVDSSAEALRTAGLLRFTGAAADFDWNSAFSLTLQLEFAHESLTALFEVTFNADFVGVDIRGIAFRDALTRPEDGLERFTRAISDLRRLDS